MASTIRYNGMVTKLNAQQHADNGQESDIKSHPAPTTTPQREGM